MKRKVIKRAAWEAARRAQAMRQALEERRLLHITEIKNRQPLLRIKPSAWGLVGIHAGDYAHPQVR